jgi:hypothetical protein
MRTTQSDADSLLADDDRLKEHGEVSFGIGRLPCPEVSFKLRKFLVRQTRRDADLRARRRSSP